MFIATVKVCLIKLTYYYKPTHHLNSVYSCSFCSLEITIDFYLNAKTLHPNVVYHKRPTLRTRIILDKVREWMIFGKVGPYHSRWCHGSLRHQDTSSHSHEERFQCGGVVYKMEIYFCLSSQSFSTQNGQYYVQRVKYAANNVLQNPPFRATKVGRISKCQSFFCPTTVYCGRPESCC